jgi:hypothetical protein
MDDLGRFEKFLQNKKEFLENMILIVTEEDANECFRIQLDTIDDIIHHFNVIVKGEKSNGISI